MLRYYSAFIEIFRTSIQYLLMASMVIKYMLIETLIGQINALKSWINILIIKN